MLSGLNNKMLIKLALLLATACAFVSCFFGFFNGIYYKRWSYNLFISWPWLIFDLCLLGVAGLYGLEFLAKRKMEDAISCALVGISVVILLAGRFFGLYMGGIIRVLLDSLFIIAFALRARKTNPFLFLLLAGAFVAKTIIWYIVFRYLYMLPNFILNLFEFAVEVGSIGLCFLAASGEPNE